MPNKFDIVKEIAKWVDEVDIIDLDFKKAFGKSTASKLVHNFKSHGA